MSEISTRLKFLVVAALLFTATQRISLAGSATWSMDPTNSDWNTATNWMPQTVPNSASDTATFNASKLTNLSVSFGSVINLDSAVFNTEASAYTVTLNVSNLILNGTGLVNNSSSIQSIVIPEADHLVGAIFLFNRATAGSMTSISTVGGLLTFYDESSAGSAILDLSSGSLQGNINFYDSSTAADATINASAGSVIEFFDSAKGGNATLNLTSEAFVLFESDNNAEHMTANCIGGDSSFGSAIEFEGFSSAGEGTFTTVGASVSGEKGAYIILDNHATAANGTFIIGGGLGTGLAGTTLTFFDTTTAAAANITAQGGVGGSDGGTILFEDRAKGGTASLSLQGNGALDIGDTQLAGITVGSLTGDGLVYLGTKTPTIGSNGQSTSFSGVIQESGGVTKIGTGTLTLTGANLYTGTTTVSGGVLNVANRRGSATGAGAVQVNTGTLGGRGIIAGPVIVNSGAFLAPAVGSNKQTTLTIQSALTMNAGATYSYTFKAKQNKSRTDLVVANGVTLNGASINLTGQIQGSLRQGLTLTLISNTSASPISGTFSNLPNGGIVNVNGNNFQASYSGGDGNDLTLTVVP